MSSGRSPNVSTNVPTKSTMARWLTTTPFGVPVEPDVNSTYAASLSTMPRAVRASPATSTGHSTSSSAVSTSASGKRSRAASRSEAAAMTALAPDAFSTARERSTGAAMSTGT